MEIITGSKINIEECVSIAKSLPEYFTEKALISIKSDLTQYGFFIAIDIGKVFGFLIFKIKSTEVAELCWLAVSPDRQRNGIGTLLVEKVARHLKNKGIKILNVKTLAKEIIHTNDPYELTRGFYKKLGFIHIETIEQYPGWDDGNPCAIYAKIL